MELDPTYLTLSLLFSLVGLALFVHGKKTNKMPRLTAGLALMICPYFITNPIAMTLVCVVVAVVPFIIPEF